MENDIDRVLWTEEEISFRVSELASEISGDLGRTSSPTVIVGVATGALLFLADIVRKIHLPVTVDFVRVESYGSGTESSGAPRITSDVKIDVTGKHVVVYMTAAKTLSLRLRTLWILVIQFRVSYPISNQKEHTLYLSALFLINLQEGEFLLS